MIYSALMLFMNLLILHASGHTTDLQKLSDRLVNECIGSLYDKALESSASDGTDMAWTARGKSGRGRGRVEFDAIGGHADLEGMTLASAVSALAYVPTLEAFETLLAESAAAGKILVAKFTASWCPPCKMIAPLYEELAAKNTHANFVQVDVDANVETTQKCGVASMPTFKFYKDKVEVGMVKGANAAQLTELVETLVSPAR